MASVFANARQCTNEVSIECALGQYYGVYLVDDYVERVCVPLCPEECKSVEFSSVSTTFELLGEAYVELMGRSPVFLADFASRGEAISAETARKSVAKVNVFYESLSYTQSEETPQWTGFSLLATMGGNLGLFLCVGFFGVCEVFTALIEIAYMKKSKNEKNDSVVQISQLDTFA